MKLDNRIRELIAVGASVTGNCQPCLQYHVNKALENGADNQEILEAIEVAKMVRKGAMTKMDTFSSALFKASESPVTTLNEGCCGPS